MQDDSGDMQKDFRILTDDEVLAVSGGDGPQCGDTNLIGWLTRLGGVVIGSLENAGKAILSKL